MDCLFGPTLSHCSQKLLLVLLHLPDKRLITGIFVRGCPQDHFREHRCKIDSFGCEQVNQLSPVRWVSFRGNDSMSFQLTTATRQYVRRDSFIGLQEFFVGSRSSQHHVADNQQRPAIAQYPHGSIQRTPRPPLWTRPLLRHISTLAYFHLHFTSKMGIVSPRRTSHSLVRHTSGGRIHAIGRSEERRVGKECRSRWSPYH